MRHSLSTWGSKHFCLVLSHFSVRSASRIQNVKWLSWIFFGPHLIQTSLSMENKDICRRAFGLFKSTECYYSSWRKNFYRKSRLDGQNNSTKSIIQSRVLCLTLFSLLRVIHAIFKENKCEHFFSCMLTIEYV